MDPDEVEKMIARAPFHEFLGLAFEESGDGYVRFRVPFSEALTRTGGDIYHGGVLASVLDTAGTYAVITAVGEGVPTVDFRIDYLRPGLQRELVVEGELVKAGSTVAVAQATATQEQDGEWKEVAIGRGTFSTVHVTS